MHIYNATESVREPRQYLGVLSLATVPLDPANQSMRTDGQTDRHEEVKSRFSQFCERA